MKQVKVEKEIENSETLFNDLIENIQAIQSKLKSNIDEKLRKSQDQDQQMIQKLREEVTALQRKHSQLEELSRNEDHLQHLQVSQPNQPFSNLKRETSCHAYSRCWKCEVGITRD